MDLLIGTVLEMWWDGMYITISLILFLVSLFVAIGSFWFLIYLFRVLTNRRVTRVRRR